MKIVQAKSPCCRERTQGYGQRRRRCSLCQRVFTVYPHRRGRKRLRTDRSLVERVFFRKLTLKQLSLRRGATLAVIKKRFRKALLLLDREERTVEVPRQGNLILLVDGERFRFKGERYVLYLTAVKMVDDNKACFFDPILLKGDEDLTNWQRVIDRLDEKVKERIVALVADDFRGCRRIVRENSWIFQRCQFHLLYQLHRRRLKLKRPTPQSLCREKSYQLVRDVLKERDEGAVKRLIRLLRKQIRDPLCLGRFRSLLQSVVADQEYFRAYLNHPAFNIPPTNNAVESMAKIIRRQAGSLSSPKSLKLWSKGIVRYHHFTVCNGGGNQQN